MYLTGGPVDEVFGFPCEDTLGCGSALIEGRRGHVICLDSIILSIMSHVVNQSEAPER